MLNTLAFLIAQLMRHYSSVKVFEKNQSKKKSCSQGPLRYNQFIKTVYTFPNHHRYVARNYTGMSNYIKQYVCTHLYFTLILYFSNNHLIKQLPTKLKFSPILVLKIINVFTIDIQSYIYS